MVSNYMYVKDQYSIYICLVLSFSLSIPSLSATYMNYFYDLIGTALLVQ